MNILQFGQQSLCWWIFSLLFVILNCSFVLLLLFLATTKSIAINTFVDTTLFLGLLTSAGRIPRNETVASWKCVFPLVSAFNNSRFYQLYESALSAAKTSTNYYLCLIFPSMVCERYYLIVPLICTFLTSFTLYLDFFLLDELSIHILCLFSNRDVFLYQFVEVFTYFKH